jgi:hypothetical protein
MPRKVLGIVGSYRKGGAVDTLVSEALRSAQEAGAETAKIYLVDRHIEFCTNCRSCTQEPGPEPGPCLHDDEMRDLLGLCLAADGLVLGAPVNFYNVNALTRRFMERLVCLAYWPWESHGGPQMRRKAKTKRAVLITSAAMPALLVPLATGALRALRTVADVLGARPVATVVAGLAGERERPKLSVRTLAKARSVGRRLAAG